MTVDQVLRELRDGPAVTLPAAFQGLPGMAHGGTVLALFDAAAGRAIDGAGDDGPRAITGHYVKRVPLGSPLRLEIARSERAVDCRLLEPTGAVLVLGRTTPGTPHGEAGGIALPSTVKAGAHPLPVSASCFVCGVTNELGLRARFSFDQDVVRASWRPRAGFARTEGSLVPAALTSLLDEAAFWLGALATGEAGMTTELAVTLHRTADARAVVTVLGDRARVTPRLDDPRYLETSVQALDETGAALATARIVFVAVRGSARRLASGMLAMNGADVLRRVFPAYVD